MKPILLKLFIEFASLGFFSYGGGLGVLTLLQDRVYELNWMTNKQFADMIAISQSTPGPIAINLATFVGYFQGSYLGSFAATVGVIIPGTTISLLLAKFMDHFHEKPIVRAMLKGLRSVVIGLIATAIVNISLVTIIHYEAYQGTHMFSDLFDIKSMLFFIITVLLVLKFKKHPIYYIIPAGILGIFIW